jgi:YVTN family beta-propeller protein
MLLSGLFLFSCNEEKIINDVEINEKFAIVVDSLNPKLMLYDTKDGIVANDKYFDVNGVNLGADVSKISEYGGMLFLLMPTAYKIEVIDKFTFKKLATIDFSADKLEPSDICFANSTDAYVCHGNDTTLSLVDIYNLQIARKIKVGRNPISLACAGNQIYVANLGDNTVSVVDSRTHKQEAVIAVNTAPCLVAASNDNEKILVVSIGDGKINKEKQKTAAKATFFNINNRTITSDLELGTLKTKAIDQYPVNLILTINDWAYIQTTTHLFRLDAKRESGINTLSSDNNSMIVYHKLRNQLLIVNNMRNKVKIANAGNAGEIKSFDINSQIRAIHPL